MSDEILLEGNAEGDWLRLAGAGAWTATRARRLEALITRVVSARAPIKRVDIDMSRVERLDTYGALLLERMEREFDRMNRILVPNLGDWTEAGRVLARLAGKYGYEKIGQGRLANDALIAMSAARMGARVITVNERDFRKLAEFRSFQWEVSIF